MTPKEASLRAEFSKYIKETAASVVIEMPSDPRRIFFLRPSSLPFCGLRRFVKYATEGVHTTNSMDSGGYYNVNMGTQAHELVQDTLARGGRIWGDWKCTYCRHVVKWSPQRACPVCNQRMKYEEVEVSWLAWRGHLDGAFEAKRTGMWIIDYKTTREAKILKQDVKVAAAYKHQQDRYVIFVEEKHNVDISGWCLAYASRDDIYKNNYLVPHEVSQKEKKLIRDRAVLESNLHKRIWLVDSESKVERLIQHKLCQSKEQHDANFPWQPCPLVNVCFRERSLNDAVMKAIDIGTEAKRLPLIKLMPEPIRFELYKK